VNETRVLSQICPDKDVDGLHPENIGKLALKGHHPLFNPCTPLGCLKLIKHAFKGQTLEGKRVVILGRSNIVGMPLSLMLTHEDCTVTVCHSKTVNINSITREADIVVAAIGVPGIVKGDMIKKGAVVVDVGINVVELDEEVDGRWY